MADFDQVNAHVAGHLSDLTDNCVIFILKINSNSMRVNRQLKKLKKEKIREAKLYSFLF